MTRPIIGFLEEFTPVQRPEDVNRYETACAELDGQGEAERLQQHIEAVRAEALAEGLAEGRRQAEAEAAQNLQAQAEAHAAALADARAAWLAEEAQRFAAGLRSGLDGLEATLAEGLAEAAGAFILPALRNRTLAEFAQALADLVSGGQGPMIAIRGPADILEALRAAWGDGPAVAFTPSTELEVTAEAGDTTLQTQMHAWLDRFRSAFQVSA